MCTTEMVRLAKEFVTKLDNKLDFKDSCFHKLSSDMHECAVACPHRKSKRKKEMNKRQGKAKVREKGRQYEDRYN